MSSNRKNAKMPTKPKKKSSNPFKGRWRITWMEQWDQDFVDEESVGFFEFDDKGGGDFHFGYVQGFMDCRLTTRDGKPAVEWTWEGNDEMESAQGRGWAVIDGKELKGMLFFHQGDESEFTAKLLKGRK
jgi:hypothetical protein